MAMNAVASSTLCGGPHSPFSPSADPSYCVQYRSLDQLRSYLAVWRRAAHSTLKGTDGWATGRAVDVIGGGPLSSSDILGLLGSLHDFLDRLMLPSGGLDGGSRLSTEALLAGITWLPLPDPCALGHRHRAIIFLETLPVICSLGVDGFARSVGDLQVRVGGGRGRLVGG